MAVRLVAALLVTLLSPAVAGAQPAVDSARALVARYHEDPVAIDRARDALEAALQRDRQVDTMVMLSYVHFLYGDVRATATGDKLAAYDRGRELGRRAVELAPKSHDAHLWYAINTGRWGQTKGIMRSLFLLPTVREEIDIVLALNPRSVRGHALAGNVLLELPGLVGGDRAKAEEHFRRALEADPRFTVARVDLARALIAGGRYEEARRELQRVIAERAPTLVADWTVKDLPRARALLASIQDKP
ncbi:MAG: tetratricopeptide repeat protein [Candidatus Rokuibacteriota bacterium]